MKNIRIILLAMFALSLSLQSCQKDELETTQAKDSSNEVEVAQEEIPEVILNRLADFQINTDGIKKIDFYLPDGTTQEMYEVEGDIILSEKQIMELTIDGGGTNRNYHTNNLVNQNTVIDIIGYTGGGGFGLTQKERNGLQWAVNNYNALNLSITFNLTYGTNYQPKDIVVYHNPNQGGSGGSAGFPSGGAPYKWVQVYGLDGFNTNVAEHVIGHEIGHAVGFRHTDWQTRQSCGQNVNEGTAGVGANPIPGTPAGYDPTSLMLACFSGSTNGEFNSNDITALNYLY